MTSAPGQLTSGPATVLHELFTAAADRWPQATALVLPSTARRERHLLTYAELDALAGRFTEHLLPTSEREEIVAILLPRTTSLLYAAQIGVLRAGSAYVCLDPVFPDQQLYTILSDCRAVTVLTDASGRYRLQQAGYQGRLILAGEPVPPLPGPAPRSVGPADAAYVIYTSGTTGRPKGVVISHGSIVSLISSDMAEFALGPGDRIAQGSSCAYDSSVEESWMALASGAALVILDDETARLGPDLVPWLRNERITVLCPVPTLLRSTGCTDPGEELPDLRLVYTGGEALSEDIATVWARGPRLVNGYGPTECTVTCVRQDIAPGERIAIGHPVPGTQAWVLDENLQPVPDGVEGELYVGGEAPAIGYLHQPRLTAERFPVHRLLGRLYRTGDLAYQEPDGTLVYCGRVDSQVKLRGHRIELEAVEACLAGAPGVREVACCVQDEGAGQILVAHVVPSDDAAPPGFGELSDHVRRALPPPMVPARFGLASSLPRGVSGKLRRDLLPTLAPYPPQDELPGPGGKEPDGVLAVVARAAGWVLGLREVPLHADFFTDLGGSSVHAAALVSELRAVPATASLTVRDVYEARTISVLASRAVRQGPPQSTGASPQIPAPEAGSPLTATAVQAAWLLTALVAVSAVAYQMAYRLLPPVYHAVGATAFLFLTWAVLPLARLVWAPVAVLLAALAKRTLVGSYVPERVPGWSRRAVRMWLVRQAVRTVPWRTLAGTEYQCMALRVLGARIGRRVHIHRGVDVLQGGWDLLEIGDDVTLGQDAGVQLVTQTEGHLVVGPVKLEEGSTLDVRASVGPGCHVGKGARLSALSSLPNGARVPDGMLADGVPARWTGPTPAVPVLTRTGRVYSPVTHGAATLAARTVLQLVVTFPYFGSFALLLALGLIDDDGFATALNRPLDNAGPLASVAAALCFGLVPSLTTMGLAARALGKTPAGVISRWELGYVRVWLKADLVDSAGTWLSGTLMWPRWLRLAGMDIGRDCEISTVIDVVPELVSIGTGTFLADGIYLGGPRLDRGTVSLEALRLGDGVFVGNHAVLPGGCSLPDDLLIGVATPCAGVPFRPGSSWFGHPAFELPHRDVTQADRGLTHEPSALRRVNRWVWELARFAIPLIPMAGGTLWVSAVNAIVPEVPAAAAAAAFASSAASLLSVLTLCGSVLALKWALLGQVRPGVHALWSCWCSRWDFVYVVWAVVAKPLLTPLESTLLLAIYLRRMGMRIGRRVLLGEGFAHVADPDMLVIGDGATVSAMFQAHTFEDRVLKIDYIRVGAQATLADKTVPLYGAQIGRDAVVAPHSVVMKHERLQPGLRYEGVPTRHG
ncbi:amino acid adenylation domain-containing protein [Kitasatospora sp. NPDC057904]|uniref:non-ribosomal peptide synthetase n=1 Tax=unclassified Kitasatospora TaxID=2633591 RepID=UPI0036D88399